jgi:hypothetical protein
LLIPEVFADTVLSLPDNDFKTVVGIKRSAVNELIQEREQERNIPRKGRPEVMSAEEEVLAILLHLRHYPVDLLLAAMFDCSQKTLSNTRKKMLDWLYAKVAGKLHVRSARWRKDHSVQLRGKCYAFLIDGAEQPVNHSVNPLLDSRFHSAKKKRHTINILLIVSAVDHKVLYLSPSCPGSLRDIDIVHQFGAEWLNQFELTEYGLGDKGFNGLEESHRIHSPPEREQDELYAEFASFRVGVENTIARVKDWKACKDQLRVKTTKEAQILETHHKIWTIVSVFINEEMYT